MTCEMILDWFDDYMDNQLDDNNRKAFEKHLHECESCQMLVNDFQNIKEVMQDMPLVALPEDFDETLHSKLLIASMEIKAEQATQSTIVDFAARKEKKKILQFPFASKKTFQYVGAAAALVIVFASGNQLKNQMWWNPSTELMNQNVVDGGVSTEMAPVTFGTDGAPGGEMAKSGMPESAPDVVQANKGSADQVSADSMSGISTGQANAVQASPNLARDAQAGRDLIRTGDISLKVGNFEEFYKGIEAMMSQTGGYVESSSSGMVPYYEGSKLVGNQLSGSVTLRVPSNQFSVVFEGVKKMGSLQASHQNILDVTTQLTDMEASIKNLKAREDQLRSLLKMAKNVTEVMEVERELSNVRTQIDQLESSYKVQSNQVSLSTIYVNVQESPEIGSEFQKIDGNLFDRAKQALIKNINSGIRLFEMAFVALVAWFPVILVAVLGALGFTRTKTYKKWRK